MATGGNPLPYTQVRVAFSSNPLSGSYSWTDISNDVQKIEIRRGRQHVLNQFDPGQCTVTLDGRTGAYDPTNTSSTYYPNVDINKRVEVRSWWNLLSSAAGGSTLSGGWSAVASSNTLTYPSGHMEFARASGTGDMQAITASGTSGYPVQPNIGYTGMALFQASSTSKSANVTLSFYDAAGKWCGSSTGATISATSGGTTQAVASSTSPSSARYAALQCNVLAATVGLKFAITQTGIEPSGSSGTNSVWYAGGGTPIFTGFVDAWSVDWQNDMDTTVTMTATDGLRLLAQAHFGAGYLPVIASNDGATHLWSMGDVAGTAVGIDSIGGLDGAYGGTYTLGQTGANSTIDPTTSASFSGVNLGYLQLPALSPPAVFSWEFWFKGSSGNWVYPLYQIDSGGTFGAGILLTLNGYMQAMFGSTLLAGGVQDDGTWHQCVYTTTNAGASSQCLYIDGALMASSATTNTHWTNSNPLQWGAPSGVTMTAATFLQYLAFYPLQLTAAQVLNHYNAVKYGIAQTDSATFVTSLLTQITWPSGDESIVATGNSNIPSPTSVLAGTSALTALQQTSQAENGALYVNGSGQVVFQNRYTILTGPNNVSVATFGDGSGEIPYKPSPTFALDNIDLYNISQVTRTGGAMQSACSQSSIQTYGTSSSPFMANTLTESGLQITTDAEALARAQWNVSHYASPIPRVRGVTVDVAADTSNRFYQTVVRELRDRITVKRRPYSKSGGYPAAQFSQDSYIEGITHQIDPTQGTWQVSLALSPAETQSYWILDDTTYSVLDTSTRLAY